MMMHAPNTTPGQWRISGAHLICGLLICSVIIFTFTKFSSGIGQYVPWAMTSGAVVIDSILLAGDESVRDLPTDDQAEVDKYTRLPPFTSAEERTQWCINRYGNSERHKIITVAATSYHPSFLMAIYRENDIVSDSIVKNSGWESGETAEVFTLLSDPEFMQGKVMVDIGANVGWFTLIGLAKGYTVVAFEPEIENIKLLSLSTCLNAHFADRLTLYPFGLSKEETTCYLMSSDTNYGDGLTVCTEAEKRQTLANPTGQYKVRSTAQFHQLDTVLFRPNMPLQPIGLLKIDIEGHEAMALSNEGAGNVFRNNATRPPVVVAELFHCQNRECEADRPFVQLMLGRGYGAVRLPMSNNKQDVDGKITTKVYRDFDQLTAEYVVNVAFLDLTNTRLHFE